MSSALVHVAAVLAAGASRRLGQSKQLLQVGGETLVHRAARLALATQPATTLVITGDAASEVQAAVSDLPIQCLHCAEWSAGMGASLRAAVRAVSGRCDGLLVLLCDQPALTAEHLQGLVARWHAAPHRAAASGYDGIAGVPAVLPSGWFAALRALEADCGARELLRRPHADVILVSEPLLARDIDRPADLLR